MAEQNEIVLHFEFDRDAVWERVKERKAVFLDSMVWINMADGKPDAQPVKEKLREQVRAGKVFLNFPTENGHRDKGHAACSYSAGDLYPRAECRRTRL